MQIGNLSLSLAACVAVLSIGCSNPSSSADSTDSPPVATVRTADYMPSAAGTSIRYEISYPAHYISIKPEWASLTFQSTNSDSVTRRFFITSADGRLSSASLRIDASVLVYEGGSTRVPDCILFQKLNLPASIPASGKTDWTVSSAWYGAGTYVITPIPSYTAAGQTYQDCLRIDFPVGKLCFTGQKGSGFYILARNVGIVHYEAVLDESGSAGDAGETISYNAVSVFGLSPRQLIMRVVDSSAAALPGAMVDFNSGYGPSVAADANGIIRIPIYLPETDSLGSLHAYMTTLDGQGAYPMQIDTPANPQGDIDLGTVTYRLPEFSPATASLFPANGAVGVDPGTAKLRVVFSTPMGQGYSWCKVSDGEYPATNGAPVWLSSTEMEMSVSLLPGKTYTLSLNNPIYLNFRDESGKPLSPVVWTFSTMP